MQTKNSVLLSRTTILKMTFYVTLYVHVCKVYCKPLINLDCLITGIYQTSVFYVLTSPPGLGQYCLIFSRNDHTLG